MTVPPVLRVIGLGVMIGVGVHQAMLLAEIASRTITIRRMADFAVFYRSAELAAQGKNPYDSAALARTPERISAPNLNPPHAILLVIPFTFFAPSIAIALWLVASAVSAFIACRIIFRELSIWPTPTAVLSAVFVVICAAPTVALLVFFQVSWLLWGPLTWSWALARHRRWMAAAVVLGLAASIKPFLALFVPFLLQKRQWGAAIVASMTTVMSLVLGVIVLGPSTFESWLRAILSVSWTDQVFNASVFGLSDRLFNQRGTAIGWVMSPFTRQPILAASVYLVAAGVICTGSFWAMRSDYLKTDPSDDAPIDVDRMFCIVLFASLLITPLGWIYYYCLPAAPMLALVRAPQWRAAIRWRKALFVVGAISLTLSPGTLAMWQPNAWATATIGSAYFWGALALWICALTRVSTTVTDRQNSAQFAASGLR